MTCRSLIPAKSFGVCSDNAALSASPGNIHRCDES